MGKTMESDELFAIDGLDGRSPSGDRTPELPEGAKATMDAEGETCTSSVNDDIELSRRAVPVVEVEEDVCSICLDEFTTEDPEQQTECEHRFHLQCIMQWAQRSRECPMCFKTLRLRDPALNELLPFGEYVAPERLSSATASHFMVGLDAWELEHLLHRLAAVNGTGLASRRERRRHRHMQPAPILTHHPTRSNADEEAPAQRDGGHVRSRDVLGGRHAGGTGSASENGEGPSEGGNGGEAGPSGIPEEAFPQSWPPASHRSLMPTSPKGGGGDPRSPRGGRPMGVDLAAIRSRLSGLRDSLTSTTRSLKGRWGAGHHAAAGSNHHRGSAEVPRSSEAGASMTPPSGSTSAAQQAQRTTT